MPRKGARALTVPVITAGNSQRLIGGPVRVCGWSLTDGVAAQLSVLRNSAAAPGAGATIASVSLGNGVYNVQWFLEITGTPAVGDVDNVSMVIGATVVDKSVNLGAVGNYGPFQAQAVVTGGPLTLAFKAIGAATAGTTYTVNAVITAVGENQATILDGQQPIAFVFTNQGQASNFYLSEYGVQVDTEINVSAVTGQVSGTIWYYLDSDFDDPPDDTQY